MESKLFKKYGDVIFSDPVCGSDMHVSQKLGHVLYDQEVWPISYSSLQYKIGQDFMDRQL